MILLEAHALACRLGSTQAVESLELSLEEGELVGLIGPDGAGKTTSFRMLAGLQRPTGGEVRRHLDRQAVGYVPQSFSLAPDLTVLENMQFQAGLYGLTRVGQRIHQLLEAMGLDAFQDRLAGALSGGMKQKLTLCTALLTEPRLLLLDEPTTGVDPVSRREFWEWLHRVHAQGVTILFSTPYLDEAEYAHRMMLMHEGRILQEGTLAHFRRSLPGLVFQITSPQRRQVQKLLAELNPLDLFAEGETIRVRFPDQEPSALLGRLGALPGVTQVRAAEASLEDVFLHALTAAGVGHG